MFNNYDMILYTIIMELTIVWVYGGIYIYNMNMVRLE